ncbi:hypothetical protein D3C76_1637160 [compost metagenome]
MPLGAAGPLSNWLDAECKQGILEIRCKYTLHFGRNHHIMSHFVFYSPFASRSFCCLFFLYGHF